MNEEDLKRLHKALLLIASEIDRVCRKNNIMYSLTGGSMIGAVRHRGFIPWDDDMDIAMLRGEYEKFIKACETDLAPQFELQTLDNDSNYVYGFAKILLKGTYLVQHGHEKTKHRKGIYVDIFPFDNVPADKNKRTWHKWKNYILIKLLSRKAGCRPEGKITLKKRLLFGIVDFINIFTSKDKMKKKLIDNMMKYNNIQTEFVCAMGGYYKYDKETTLRKYFEKVTDMPFEGKMFSVITEYDAYLKSVYGDYMKLPPEEKRHTHGFQSLDFGPYNDL